MRSIPARTVIVTGGNAGLCLACTRALAHDQSGSAPWQVVVCRDQERARETIEGLQREAWASGSAARVETMRLGLASFAAVQECLSRNSAAA